MNNIQTNDASVISSHYQDLVSIFYPPVSKLITSIDNLSIVLSRTFLPDESTFLKRVVNEIKIKIFCLLEESELKSLLITSRAINKLAKSNQIWEPICLKRGIDPIILYDTAMYDTVKADTIQKAKDICQIWQILSEKIEDYPVNFQDLKNGEEYFEMAQHFSHWFNENIDKLKALYSLQLNDLSLQYLPQEIGKLENLRNLNLADNSIKSLPTQFSNLINLEVLSLDNNCLTSLPSEITQLYNLEFLWLNDNQITHLPDEIGFLNKLEGLFIFNNKLEVLPWTIGQLTNLIELGLSNNHLIHLPFEIIGLTNLVDLYLDNNPIEFFPNEIFQLPNLSAFYFHDN